MIVGPRGTPYVAFREQSPSFVALSSLRLERSDGSLRTGPGWRPHRKLGAAGLRKDCQAGGGYRKPEVGRTLLGPAMRCFPVLAKSWPFDGSMAQRPPRTERRLGRRSLAPVRDPTPRSEPMARRMLIDASHPEETRVVVVDGTRLEEFDFETATRKPLKEFGRGGPAEGLSGRRWL